MSALSFLLLRISFFLIPLESLGFTVSKGWNALAYLPILLAFFLEVFFSGSSFDLLGRIFSTNIARRLAFFLILAISFSIPSYILHGLPPFASLLDLLIKIIASISFVCLLIFCEIRYSSKIWTELTNSLLYGYLLSILIHLTSGFGIPFLLKNARIGSSGLTAFTFTEPSFISVHVYYVLLLLLCFPQALLAKTQKYKLLIALSFIFFITLAEKIALRPFVDFFVIGIIFSLVYICSLIYNFFARKSIPLTGFYFFPLVILLIFLLPVASAKFSRFGILISSLVDNDISILASFDVSSFIRIFSMDVLLPRFSSLYEMFFGFGIGNVCSASLGLKPLVFKYQDISSLIRIDEIYSIINANCILESFSMLVALVAETGIFLSVFFFSTFYSKCYIFIFSLLLASSFQFNSFSLYIFPLYSYLLIHSQINGASRQPQISSIHRL